MLYFLLISSWVLNGFAQLLWKMGLSEGFSFEIGRLLALFSNIYFLGWCGLYGISIVLWFVVLSKTDVSFAYPFLALSFLIVTIGWYFLGESITPFKLFGLFCIVAGIFCIARS